MGRLRIRSRSITMIFFDIHTHNRDTDRKHSISNSASYIAGRYISIGLHPWDIDSEWNRRLDEIEKAAYSDNVLAIGECGFDKIKSPAETDTQKEIFHLHALIAEKVSKPLIIHCVKCTDELIAAYREIKPRQPWIIHGFRGNSQQAGQLVRCGFHISLGEHFNTDAARAIPAERLFIESDESEKDIEGIYRSIAAERGCSIEELDRIVTSNVIRTFREIAI